MNRRIVAALSIVLIALQAVSMPMSPVYAAAAAGAGCDHSGTVHAWHPMHCDGDMASDDSTTPRHPVGHQCRCIHAVPSLGLATGLPLATPAVPEPEAIAGRLPGAAYPAPLFDILRPPN